jgi:murein DD-endopeptidase MepM/ murein hydrolase activator NlpD
MRRYELFFSIFCLIFFVSCGKGDEKECDLDKEKEAEIEHVLTFDQWVDLLKGLKPVMPVEDAHFTDFFGQLPNAPRKYRSGFHEGIDFYNGFCGVTIKKGTSVRAIADGMVIRSDTLYTEIEPAKRKELLAEAHNAGDTPETTLDILRGCQVWIDHGNGIITRYCHLSGVSTNAKGKVTKGMVIGYIGGSGTESRTPHLHFEIRFGDDYFGRGKTPEENKKVLDEIFGME